MEIYTYLHSRLCGAFPHLDNVDARNSIILYFILLDLIGLRLFFFFDSCFLHTRKSCPTLFVILPLFFLFNLLNG